MTTAAATDGGLLILIHQHKGRGLNSTEAEMLAYIRRRHAEGAESVSASEVMAAVVPPDHPEYRFRPAYKHGLDRLHRRHVILSTRVEGGEVWYRAP